MQLLSICQTGNGDPPPKKPPTDDPTQPLSETPDPKDAK